jgi:hypothetical protein
LVHREFTIELAAKHRLPAMYPYRAYAASVGRHTEVNLEDMYRRAANWTETAHAANITAQ